MLDIRKAPEVASAGQARLAQMDRTNRLQMARSFDV
jgi:hypothetical protein